MSPPHARSPGPHHDPRTGALTFVVDDDPEVTPLRVWYHLRDFDDDPTLHQRGSQWVAHIPAPPVDRLEYLLAIDGDGGEALVPDPAAPGVVAGVFGDHSVLELPAYREPAWLTDTATEFKDVVPISVTAGTVTVTGELWSPAGVADDVALPLLVAHDGPEYDQYSRLGHYLGTLDARDERLRCRVLLLGPVDRNRTYSALPDYAAILVEHILPLARRLVATTAPVVGVGASLGAVGLLHAAVTYPGTFKGLLLQSGSFFLPDLDAQERQFAYFDRVVDFVAGLTAEPERLAGLTVTVTAGLGEENLDNNRALAERLRGLGLGVSLVEGRDAHNHVAWRDLLDPALADLLRRVWAIEG